MCRVILSEEEMLALIKAINDKDHLDSVFYRDEVLDKNCDCSQCNHLRKTCACNAEIHLRDWYYNTQLKK